MNLKKKKQGKKKQIFNLPIYLGKYAHMRRPNQSWPNWVLIIYNDISYDVMFLRTC